MQCAKGNIKLYTNLQKKENKEILNNNNKNK